MLTQIVHPTVREHELARADRTRNGGGEPTARRGLGIFCDMAKNIWNMIQFISQPTRRNLRARCVGRDFENYGFDCRVNPPWLQ